MNHNYKNAKVMIEASIAFPVVILVCIGLINFGISQSKNLKSRIESETNINFNLDSEPLAAENLLRTKWMMKNLFENE